MRSYSWIAVALVSWVNQRHLGTVIGLGGGVDEFDQFAAHAGAALGRIHQQVLKVAGILDAPVGAMVDKVDHAHRLAVLPGKRRMGRLVGIDQALPGVLADGVRQFGFVELQIRLPQR